MEGGLVVPGVELHDGNKIPQLGFGTLNIPVDRRMTPPNRKLAAEIIGRAISVGYRHLDTAQMYGNEEAVGDAVASSGIPRGEFFITSKLGNGNHDPADVHRSFEATLDRLAMDYVDLFLVHWPLPTLYDSDLVSTWKAMAGLLADGRARSIGVSNFQPEHLDRIVQEVGVVPVIDQFEIHPGFNNAEVVAACARHGIAVEAWGPLGQGKLLQHPEIDAIAHAVGRTTAQVILRWHIQHGNIVFPKSTRLERMRENLDVFDFELSETQMQAIDALDQGEAGRIGPHPSAFDWVPAGGAGVPGGTNA